jgi:ABC-2 type transport system permease protein
MPPIITMRLFAEEKRTGTIETLMTAPVTDVQVVLGKFLAALCFFALIWSTLLLDVGILEVFGNPDWGPVAAFYVGLLGLGALFIAVGLLASALTRNQLIAAMVSLNFNLFLFFLQWCRGLFTGNPDAQRFFDFISIYHHFYNDYSRGLIDVRYLLLYFSFAALVLYFTVMAVEARKCR